MDLLEELKELGANTEEGLERLSGNKALYERMLGKLLKLLQSSAPNPDFDCKNYLEEGIIEQAHAIKGATGNLSVTPLYDAYTQIVNLLRAGQPEEAKKVLQDIQSVQKKIMACLEQHS
jgi:HPt (histidine-containing phosphotransfer) domain-containing protein